MHDRPRHASRLAAVFALCRNLIFASLLYALVFGIIQLARTPGRAKGKLGIPAVLDKSGPADIIRTTKLGVQVKFAASSTSVTINPHANVFNRPTSLVVAKDDYLGLRPHVDTEADFQVLVNECRGTYLGMEKVRNILDCLNFLETGEDKYFKLPPMGDRASQQDPRKSEYANSDKHDNTWDKYEELDQARKSSRQSVGTCPGPIIPYHTYWSGAATWRLEMFIKSYLYTQNLPCSRLYIWLDQDRYPTAVTHMLTKDPLFARFLPFVDRGDIILTGWNFPTKIPLPKTEDNTDGTGYKIPPKPNSKGETTLADGIIEDSHGQQWLVLSPKQMTLLPQAVSDAVRFVVLHLHGGVFFDIDVLMLRDMRPLVLPKQHGFASRWAAYPHPGDYSAAVLSLTANSSLSSYLLRGGVRMGLNFHPRVIGRMAWKDGRDQELVMLESAVFDPMWTEANWGREGRCTVPCLKDYTSAFKGKANVLKEEWESYDGPQAEIIDINNPPSPPNLLKDHNSQSKREESTLESSNNLPHRQRRILPRNVPRSEPSTQTTPEHPNTFTATSDEEDELRSAGAIADYRLEEDKFPPNNRTLDNFYHGAWAYNVHDQGMRHPEPSSWLSVIQQAHDGFFSGQRKNAYSEIWTGPELMPYYFWPEFV
jgi:Glycosyltransferase sugar-binding region containing DXD motif